MSDHESNVWRAIDIAAARHNIPPTEIHDKRNITAAYVDARRTAFYEANKMGVPGVEIAKVFNLDSSTVYYHLRAEGVRPMLKDCLPKPRPTAPLPPSLPENPAQWSMLDRMRAMAHAENQAMGAAYEN